ncbi:hypothetical protein EVAR_6935_1 [Eumeta japonica]|uniref:Uncharacterized protein n=1 Tax=Eumeta variegata TaxID=151549 RepID=A0A4C1TGG7_EUMVA|nr:hypothetical protein EVAR_6935_1 [Eumeta japonica]
MAFHSTGGKAPMVETVPGKPKPTNRHIQGRTELEGPGWYYEFKPLPPPLSPPQKPSIRVGAVESPLRLGPGGQTPTRLYDQSDTGHIRLVPPRHAELCRPELMCSRSDSRTVIKNIIS